jgi:hypothetical protein
VQGAGRAGLPMRFTPSAILLRPRSGLGDRARAGAEARIDSLKAAARRLWRAMPPDSLSGARRALVGARDRLVKHGLLVDRLRLEGPSAALDLGLAQLRVFERDHIVAEAVFLAVRARLRL